MIQYEPMPEDIGRRVHEYLEAHKSNPAEDLPLGWWFSQHVTPADYDGLPCWRITISLYDEMNREVASTHMRTTGKPQSYEHKMCEQYMMQVLQKAATSHCQAA